MGGGGLTPSGLVDGGDEVDDTRGAFWGVDIAVCSRSVVCYHDERKEGRTRCMGRLVLEWIRIRLC